MPSKLACAPNFLGNFLIMCHRQYLCRVSGKTIAIAFFIALSRSVIIAFGAWPFMHSNQDLNNHTNVSIKTNHDD
jgi:hypothetical protein